MKRGIRFAKRFPIGNRFRGFPTPDCCYPVIRRRNRFPVQIRFACRTPVCDGITGWLSQHRLSCPHEISPFEPVCYMLYCYLGDISSYALCQDLMETRPTENFDAQKKEGKAILPCASICSLTHAHVTLQGFSHTSL